MDKICDTCQHILALNSGIGKCHLTSNYTSLHNSCWSWEPNDPSPKRKPPKEFDYGKAADRVMRKLVVINVVNVQTHLRCTYIQAAEVIERLKAEGRIV